MTQELEYCRVLIESQNQKYEDLRVEFQACQVNYQQELQRCIQEISQLREIVNSVIESNTPKPKQARSRKQRKSEIERDLKDLEDRELMHARAVAMQSKGIHAQSTNIIAKAIEKQSEIR